MTPVEIMDAASIRWAELPEEARAKTLEWGGKALCACMGWREAKVAIADAVLQGWEFARVRAAAVDLRSFELLPAGDPGGRPCVLVPLTPLEGGRFTLSRVLHTDPVDVVALELKAGATWFRRSAARVTALPGFDAGGEVLQLWQSAHRFLGAYSRAALAEDRELALAHWERLPQAVRAKRPRPRTAMHPAPYPEGWLVLDPAQLGWKGAALKGIERIELVDADPKGPLGKALRTMNRRIGGRGRNAIQLARSA